MMKKINTFDFWWLVILIGNIWSLTGLLLTKEILTYLHPKLVIFSYFALCMMILMALAQCGKIYFKHNRKIRAGLILFMLPMLCKALAPYSMSDMTIAKGALMRIVPTSPKASLVTEVKPVLQSSGSLQELPPAPQKMESALSVHTAQPKTIQKKKPKLERMSAVISPDGTVRVGEEEIEVVRFKDSNFLKLIDDLYDRISLYEGKQVEVSGFVFRRPDFKSNQFVVARLYMWCCAADTVPVGPLCKWDKIASFNDGVWVKVTGVIENEFFDDTYFNEKSDIPVIKVEKIERIEKLENPYLYR